MLSGLKFASASDTAKLLHFLALCYAADNLTDGFITESAARKLTSARTREFDKAIEHLTTVQAGCTSPSWEEQNSDQRQPKTDQREPNSDQAEPNRVWFLHDYDDPLYDNPMKAHLDKRREQKSKAGAEGGKKSAQVRREKYGTAQPVSSSPEADAEAPLTKHPEAPGSGAASGPDPSKPGSSAGSAPEAAPKLARAGAHAQPFPSLPLLTHTEHGDVARVGGNGLTSSPSPQVQVLRLLDWLLAKRGWSTWSSQDSQQHEARMALNIVELGIPREQLFAQLDSWWSESDPDDRPSSLEYFWTRLQDEQHAALKQGRPHVHVDNGPTKIEPKVKRRG